MELDLGTLITGTLGFVTMAGGIVAVYVKSNEKQALAEQQNRFTNQQVEKLESRVALLEKNVAERIDSIHEDLTEIKISIGKLLNKQL